MRSVIDDDYRSVFNILQPKCSDIISDQLFCFHLSIHDYIGPDNVATPLF